MDSKNFDDFAKLLGEDTAKSAVSSSELLEEALKFFFKTLPAEMKKITEGNDFYSLFAEDVSNTYWALYRESPAIAKEYVVNNGGFGFQLAKTVMKAF